MKELIQEVFIAFIGAVILITMLFMACFQRMDYYEQERSEAYVESRIDG